MGADGWGGSGPGWCKCGSGPAGRPVPGWCGGAGPGRPVGPDGQDRPPAADEITACLPYLKRQIALIEPTVIVALGKTAATALLERDDKTALADLRETPHRVGELPVVVTYHPAYLLRKPADKAKSWRDLCLARSLVDGR